MYNREQVEERLRIGKVQGLPEDLKGQAGRLATEYVRRYSVKCGYDLNYDYVRNRIENLMLEKLMETTNYSKHDIIVEAKMNLSRLFVSSKDIAFLVELSGISACLGYDYFEYVIPFFSMKVRSYIKHNSYFIAKLELDEVITILFAQVDKALKCCYRKGVDFSFITLDKLFRAALLELRGVEHMPYRLGRKDMEQYERFKAKINDIRNQYEYGEVEELSRILSVSKQKIKIYWELHSYEECGVIRDSISEDENYSADVFGGYCDAEYGYIELVEMVYSIFHDPIEQNIVLHIMENGSVFKKEDIMKLHTTRYQINRVLSVLRNSQH